MSLRLPPPGAVILRRVAGWPKTITAPFRFLQMQPSCSSVLSVRMDRSVHGEAEGMQEYTLDGTKITRLVHSTWKQVVTVGDTVIDATCGKGYDTLELAKLSLGDSSQGLVYGFDLQKTALENTISLMERELSSDQRARIHLYHMCHSKMEEVIMYKGRISVVAFNLGYLPGGDKHLITEPQTTIQALDAATKLVRAGGIVTIVSYVGHPGGRDEYEAVREFSANLPANSWVCSQREWLNRPLCPRFIVLYKKEKF